MKYRITKIECKNCDGNGFTGLWTCSCCYGTGMVTDSVIPVIPKVAHDVIDDCEVCVELNSCIVLGSD